MLCKKNISGAVLQSSPAFRPENSVFNIIEIHDFKSNLGLHNKALVSEIFIFARIRVKSTIETIETIDNYSR